MSKRLKIAEQLLKDPTPIRQRQLKNAQNKNRLQRLINQIDAATNIVAKYKDERPPDQPLRQQSPQTPHFKSSHDDDHSFSLSPKNRSIDDRSKSSHRKIGGFVERRSSKSKSKSKSKSGSKGGVVNGLRAKSRAEQMIFRNDSTRYDTLEKTLNTLQNRVITAKTELVKHNVSKAINMNKQGKNDKEDSEANSQKSNTETIVKKSYINPLSKVKSLEFLHLKHHKPVYYVCQVVKALQQKKSAVLQHVDLAIKCARFQKQRGRQHDQAYKQRKLQLPPTTPHKKTIVFDLDETLVRCHDKLSDDQRDVNLNVLFPTGQSMPISISIRPHAITLLKKLSLKFQLIIFTGSQKPYAKAVLDFLDPDNLLFHHRLYKQSCYYLPQGFIKDLRVLNRNLSEIVLVDNSPFAYVLQPENGVPILPFEGCHRDCQLKMLEEYLMRLEGVQDVREVNARSFGLNRYVEFREPGELIGELYKGRR